MPKGKARLVLELLRESEEEGEDISFGEVLASVLTKAPELAQHARDLWKLSPLPPRVALALLYLSPEWRPYARVAAHEFLAYLVDLKETGCQVEAKERV